jgi:hypothetical protein
MPEDLGDDFWLLDAGNDPEPAGAPAAALDLDPKHPLQAPRTVHRHMTRGRRLSCIGRR